MSKFISKAGPIIDRPEPSQQPERHAAHSRWDDLDSELRGLPGGSGAPAAHGGPLLDQGQPRTVRTPMIAENGWGIATANPFPHRAK